MLVFLAIGAALWLVVWSSHAYLAYGDPDDGNPDSQGYPTTEPAVGAWLQYDSSWYLDIAANGYTEANVSEFKAGRQSSVAFWPAYPLTARAVAQVVGDYPWAMHVTTLAAGLGFALLLWLWLKARLEPPGARAALLLVLLYPYAYFLFGSGYGDALFLASAMGAFVLLDRGWPVLAGVVALAATAGRPTGAAVVIGLVAVALERRGVLTRDPARADDSAGGVLARERARWRFQPGRARAVDAGVLLSLSGIVGYCLYLAHRVGDPFAFLTVQGAPGWDQGAGVRTWLKFGFLGRLRDEPFSGFTPRLILQGALALIFIAAIPWVVKRFGWGYGAYTAAILLIPFIGTGDFQGMGRYLLGAFPVFALAGEHLAGRIRLQQAVLAVSAVALVGFASMYARGYYLT
ncbi:MAG: hypothetical protein ACT4PW_12625 [Acidimicrobiia bacterium]